MKFVIVTLILFSFAAPIQRRACRCISPRPDETTHWGGNEIVTYKEMKILESVSGVVIRPDGQPLDDALIEIFDPPSSKLSEYYPEGAGKEVEPRRIAACKTGKDGRFCFGKLPAGKYELRVSKDEHGAWSPTHVFIVVDPRNRKSTGAVLEVHLNLGF